MAENTDSIEFFADCPGWFLKSTKAIDTGTKPLEVAKYLAFVRRNVDIKAFTFLNLDLAALSKAASKMTEELKGISSLPVAYKRMAAKDGKEAVESAVMGEEHKKPFANAYLFRMILENLKLDYTLHPDRNRIFAGCADGIKNESKGSKDPSNAISFIAKYGKWVSIKKMNIREDTKPEEIAAHLTSIRLTLDKKAFEYTGLNAAGLDDYVASLGKMRRSAENLEKAINILNSKATDVKVAEFSKGTNDGGEVARIYLLRQMLQAMKLNFDVSPEELTSAYPNLKIPMPPGRKPKK